MISEWEELESWSKEDLIIELVKERRTVRNICSILKDVAENRGEPFLYDEGSKPSKIWLERIATRAKAGLEPGEELCDGHLQDYGVDEGTAEEYIWGNRL